MSQRIVILTIPNVGTKDLIRSKSTLTRLLYGEKYKRVRAKLSPRSYERLEALLSFLDACTDEIKDGTTQEMGIGKEDWEVT